MKGVWEIGVCARPGVLVSVHHGPELSSKAAAKQKQGYVRSAARGASKGAHVGNGKGHARSAWC